MTKRNRVVAVSWVDAALHDGEYPADSDVLRPAKATSVGLLVKDEPDFIVIALDLFDDGDYRCCESIPRSQITKVLTVGYI